jgi:nucleoside phosphorylase
MGSIAEPRSHNDYTIGWVCALPAEQTAAKAMLDEIHASVPKPPGDPNNYTLGSIGSHNIVIACLPKGQIGNNSSATVATWMVSTFPRIKFGLMVGIGGGVPPKVRLGDVVVSTPVGQFPGVVQWDMGKARDGGTFERTGALNNPPTALVSALAKLETEHEMNGTKIPQYLGTMKANWPALTEYLRSDSLEDVLFKTDCHHVEEIDPDDEDGWDEDDDGCRACDKTMIVKRKPRGAKVHYGLIASGNQVIKNAAFRKELNQRLGNHVLCVEMEAAGLMNNFPCVVIRGICDYADSHKNKAWQRHAAAMAAGLAKELLQYVSADDVEREPTVKNLLNQG